MLVLPLDVNQITFWMDLECLDVLDMDSGTSQHQRVKVFSICLSSM